MARNEPTSLPTQPASPTPTDDVRKPYTPPAIKHELALETRAGSPLGLLTPFNPRPRV